MKRNISKKKPRNNSSRINPNVYKAIAAIAIVLFIIFYLLSLGQLKLPNEESEKSRQLKWIEEQLQTLGEKIHGKIELKKKLDERVKQLFFTARVGLVLLYIFCNFCLYNWVIPSSQTIYEHISTLLNYNQVGLIALLIILFLKFENQSQFYDIIKMIHLYIKEIVYNKHKELEREIEEIKREMENLQNKKLDLLSD